MTFSDVIIFSDVNLNDGILWCPLQPVYIKHDAIFDCYLSLGMDKDVWGKIC